VHHVSLPPLSPVAVFSAHLKSHLLLLAAVVRCYGTLLPQHVDGGGELDVSQLQGLISAAWLEEEAKGSYEAAAAAETAAYEVRSGACMQQGERKALLLEACNVLHGLEVLGSQHGAVCCLAGLVSCQSDACAHI
jgi:hypothetical protein